MDDAQALYVHAAEEIAHFAGEAVCTHGEFTFCLSGGSTPVESQPRWLQSLTYLLPTRHFVSFSQVIIYRGVFYLENLSPEVFVSQELREVLGCGSHVNHALASFPFAGPRRCSLLCLALFAIQVQRGGDELA